MPWSHFTAGFSSFTILTFAGGTITESAWLLTCKRRISPILGGRSYPLGCISSWTMTHNCAFCTCLFSGIVRRWDCNGWEVFSAFSSFIGNVGRSSSSFSCSPIVQFLVLALISLSSLPICYPYPNPKSISQNILFYCWSQFLWISLKILSVALLLACYQIYSLTLEMHKKKNKTLIVLKC